MFKNTDEKYVTNMLSFHYFWFCWFLTVVKELIICVFFLFFSLTWFTCQNILDEKGMDAIFKQKNKKIVNWHKNGSFSVVFKDKGCNYHMYTISRVCPTYILFYILLMVYHLFIWHYIFKNHIGRNDFWNLG